MTSTQLINKYITCNAILFVKEAEKLYYFFIIKSLIGALIYSKFHSPNVIKITVMILYFTRIKYPSLIVKKILIFPKNSETHAQQSMHKGPGGHYKPHLPHRTCEGLVKNFFLLYCYFPVSFTPDYTRS